MKIDLNSRVFNCGPQGDPGMSMREYFAGLAMQGFCANSHSWEEHDGFDRAKAAVAQADALVAELNKEQA